MCNMRRSLLAVSCLVAALGAGIGAQAPSDVRLVAAMKRQDAAAVKALLKERADVNAADVDGTTALQWAAHWNDLDTVKALIAAGAKANVASRYGVTPLHEAATIGSAAIVNALLRAGAAVDATYGEGETPLMLAARSGNLETVKLLLEAGANVERRRTIPRADAADAGGGREPRIGRSGADRCRRAGERTHRRVHLPGRSPAARAASSTTGRRVA